MRNFDVEDPKKPRPVVDRKKGTNPLESAEGIPWRECKDEGRDRHRHV